MNDPDLRHVKPTKSVISAHGDSKLLVMGQVTLRVWRNSRYQLTCKLVDCNVRRKACLSMNIIKHTDNDAIYKLQTKSASVYLLENREEGMSKENLLKHFLASLLKRLQLDGEYQIKVDATVNMVQHPPRRVPVALRDRLKAELDRNVSQDVITPVTTPAPWVSSLGLPLRKTGG